MPLVTLLTDFGLSDPYAGEMRGVVKRIAPGVEIVDLTHGVSPGGIREGAWILGRAWDLFPVGTCHLAVVDPGVGGARRGLAAAVRGHVFVGPDNGLLAPVLEAAPGDREIREISVREIDRPRRGTTFDGRDVFAPLAARLASGAKLAEVGPEVHDPIPMAPFHPVEADGAWRVEIIRTDRFGNLVTVAEESFLKTTFGDEWRGVSVRAGDRTVTGVKMAYEEVAEGELVLTIGSGGTLEISANRANARGRLGLRAGDHVRLEGPCEA